MIKDKKIRAMVLVLTACTLTAAGFTSQAAALPMQKGVTVMSSVSENVVSDMQVSVIKETPVNVVETVVQSAEAKHQELLAEAAKKEQEIAKQKAVEKAVQTAKHQTTDENQQKLLASIIFCEAGNQPYKGQVAVGAVVMNRIRSSSFPDSMEGVLYQKGQFGPATTGWLDKVRASGGYTDSAMKAAEDALAGANPVGDSLFFDKGGRGRKIGDHYFH